MWALRLDARSLALGVTGVLVALVLCAVLALVMVWKGPAALAAFGRGVERASADWGFAVTSVTVVGRVRSDPAAILKAAGDPVGRSILHTDIAAAKARLEALPWVRSARVRRLLPSAIRIELSEKTAIAVWSVDGDLRLIDETGALISAPSDPARDADLPLLAGAGAGAAAPELHALLRANADLRRRFDWAERIGGRRWNIQLRGGPVLILPEEAASPAVASKYAAAQARGLLGPEIEALDMRYDKDFVVRGRPPGMVRARSRGI